MREFTCIICPNGCEITVSDAGVIAGLDGMVCNKGKEYVRQEMTDPQRTFSSLVRVDGGEAPLVSVRITSPIPRDRIKDAMKEIKCLSCTAPVSIGQVLQSRFLGLECDLIAVDSIAVGSPGIV